MACPATPQDTAPFAHRRDTALTSRLLLDPKSPPMTAGSHALRQAAGAVIAPEGSSEPSDAYWIGVAIELAVGNVAHRGGPFGAVIVRDGQQVATGVNQVRRLLDPSAHAEVVAIRAACGSLRDLNLSGCTLVTSCEPCPMCLATALWARVSRIVFAATRRDAAQAGFDDRELYAMLDRPLSSWGVDVHEHPAPDATAPFVAWHHQDRTCS